MTTETDIRGGKRRIKDLTDHDIGWIHALAKVNKWPDSKIGQIYNLSDSDVRKVLDDYVEPWGTIEKNLRFQPRRREPSQELPKKKKPRKHRKDARYATTAARQSAYRARLKEKRHVDMQQPPAPSDIDPRPTGESELTRNGLPVPSAESDSHWPDTEPLT